RTSGVLWVGPPNFSELWSSFTAGRDSRSPEILPLFEGGETVRFAGGRADLVGDLEGWDQPRVLYMQHPSDPVVWWSTRLILRQPDWLRQQPGDDVLDAVRWYPLVTFWQVSADMAYANEVPAGHGHNYAGLFADGWAAVAAPPGWTAADTDRLHVLLNAQANAALAR
ncbi:MAG TPA: alpha/beta-hydrolase family protein, partial [Acidimicrobiia bacterium]|nr:alpha/beta-hydrolase family protein [Acidimicrobiia bacterium]